MVSLGFLWISLVLSLVFSLVRKRIERRLRQFSIVVLSSLFCVRKPLVRLALYALRLCFFFVVFFPLFRCWGGEEEEVCLGNLDRRKWRKVEEKREKIELFFLLFYSSFLFFFKYFSALLRNSIRKSAN